ncbi:LAFE_0H00628g1_1 [Lachancea fermentati]|uniref:LAFE_0H00628g1_1 n=1 Tax=Lachancea fermentati TaxID=4955 RepID=A0A1G4MIY3_LACFM|nr:LAFE_0H00628g1_1 [Lachancea fermentati]
MTAAAASDSKSYIFQGIIDKPGAQVVGGKGVLIDIERDGKVYPNMIDAIGGAAVASLGWDDEEVQDIIAKAATETTYSYPTLIANKEAERLAQFYIENSPKGAFSAALWCTSGSESNENALRIVRQYYLERGLPNKVKIISRESSYHGFTLGAQAISWNPRIDKFEPYLFGRNTICLKMPCAYTYRFKNKSETEEQYSQRLVDQVEKMVLDNDPDTVAAIIVETLPGSSLGTTPPPKGYLKMLRALCNKYDIIFYLDEVMCGTGRCGGDGKLNCWENFLDPDEAPDIQTVGKTLGSGYVTIAGVLVGPKIKDAFMNGSKAIFGGHTYSCHAFNCAVALGIQEKIKRENYTGNVFEKGTLINKLLTDKLLSEDNIAGDVRGVGGFQSVEFVKDRVTKEAFDTSLNVGARFKEKCFLNGLVVMGMPSNPDGSCGDRALLAPSFVLTEDDAEAIVEKFVKSVNELTDELRAEGAWN